MVFSFVGMSTRQNSPPNYVFSLIATKLFIQVLIVSGVWEMEPSDLIPENISDHLKHNLDELFSYKEVILLSLLV